MKQGEPLMMIHYNDEAKFEQALDEDHVKMGGFGSAVIETLDELGSAVPVVRIGWPDRFIEHGKVEELRTKYGLTVDAAQAQLLPLLKRTRRAVAMATNAAGG